MNDDLLPPSATTQEKALARVTTRTDHLPVTLHTLWNPATCPASLLPALAWSLSVDEWNEGWTQAQKRSVCANSTRQHAIKGSRKAVEQAIESVGGGISIQEWWEQSSPAAPHTFQVTVVGGSQAGGSITYQQQLQRLIDNAKPLRSHYTLHIGTEHLATLHVKPHLQVAVISRGTFE